MQRIPLKFDGFRAVVANKNSGAMLVRRRFASGKNGVHSTSAAPDVLCDAVSTSTSAPKVRERR